jgi:hypothetical protein
VCFVSWKMLSWFVYSDIVPVKSRGWIQSVQNVIPHLASLWSDFTIWKEVFLQSLKVTQKLWQEFFRDPSQCWDHGSEKVIEHQTCQSSHVNGATPLVGVNLPFLCWLLLSFPGLNWAEFLFTSFALVEW